MKGFFEIVYDCVKEIPSGKVATYGQLAKLVGRPKMSRFVGFALHSNPEPGNIPCHRVVNCEGKLSSAFAFGGVNVQKELLEAENVYVYDDNVVDLSIYQWDGKKQCL